MFKRLISIFLFLALSGSILSGAPLHSEKMNGEMPDCCDKAKSDSHEPDAEMARLCCAINCTDSAPTSSGTSSNFSPAAVIVSESIVKQLAELLAIRPTTAQLIAKSSASGILPRKFPPKYIQHHSFLI